MKISNKDAKLLYIVGGLLLFVVVYMYVFTPLQEKSAQMKTEIESLEKECRELEIQYTSMDAYEAEIEEFRKSVSEDLKAFPADVKEEDIVAYLLNLEETNDIELMSIAINEPLQLANFVAVVNTEGVDKNVQMTAKQIGTTAMAELSYGKLKSVLKYIYDTQTVTTLEKVTVVYDSEKKLLDGVFDFSRYALSYEDAVYTPEKLPNVTIGQSDLFGAN